MKKTGDKLGGSVISSSKGSDKLKDERYLDTGLSPEESRILEMARKIVESRMSQKQSMRKEKEGTLVKHEELPQ